MGDSILSTWLAGKRRLHFTLIDPDKQLPSEAASLAALVEEFQSDAIMVGGSTVGHEVVEDVCRRIKELCSLPVILFPNKAESVSAAADYLFFMMLMNSRDPRFLVGEQVKAAPHLR